MPQQLNPELTVEPVSVTRTVGSDFAPLLRQVREHGLLDRGICRYIRTIVPDLLLFAAAWTAVALVGNSWWQLALAVPVAVLTARSGFVGHDAGHQQIVRSRRTNRMLGLLHGNLLIGMSFAWWTDKHNRHHANPNDVDKDPDVGVGVLTWTTGQAVGRRGVAGWLTRYQAFLFFPLLLLEGFNLKVASARDLIRRGGRDRIVEAVPLVAHLACYLVALLLVMSPVKVVVFILVHQALFGIHLGCAFAPNHKGMPMPEPGIRWDHLRRQVLTSRNVRGGPLVDWFLGGLNYQIEHHLFPSMPRQHLRLAQPLVREHCARTGLPYTESGLVGSYRHALRYLHSVGAKLRN
ncbi:MAG TPA: acyl-CoA desaturase [Mycobacteriales bacterium]|nr:acyl-CoA desaturase [Mycobacteriales bacterium]